MQSTVGTDSLSYLVIGGGGFLGGHIVDHLLQRGAVNITILDIRKPSNYVENKHVQFVIGNLMKPADLLEATRGKDVVFHTASPHPQAPESVLYAVNVDGTQNVIDACVANNVPKLVFTSSSSVVTDGNEIVNADETCPYPENFADYYAKTKALAEQLVLKANNANGLLTAALRPAAIFGPRDNQAALVMSQTAKQGRTSVFIGPNKSLFDYTYVENLAYAHVLAAEKLSPNNGTGGQAFFITNDSPIFFWDFPKQLWHHMGYRNTLRYSLPAPVAMFLAYIVAVIVFILSPFRKLDVTFTPLRIKMFTTNRYFNITKAKTLLGYKPIFSLDEGLRRTAEYFYDK